jgi:hypothetical protein
VSQFTRELDKEIQEQITIQSLYQNKLCEDIKKGDVFPAIRNDYIDFYYKGGKLFGFDKNGFHTHIKYASAFEDDGDYITENDLKSLQPISDFSKGYKRIKENCALYSGVEAAGVSNLYHKFAYPQTKQPHSIVVLDIEVCFVNKEENKKKSLDRIDILLLNKKESRLRFYEAKHYSNAELWSSEGTPPIKQQILRYEDQIKKSKERILGQYENYTEIVNDLFDAELPMDNLNIDMEVSLLVFGFDRDQSGSIQNNLTQNCISNYYLIGNIKAINIDNLWKNIER